MLDLRRLVRDKIVSSVLNCTTEGFKVLVTDRHTVRILSCCMRLFELIDEYVVLVENIELRRKRFDFDGIYFLSPTKESVDLLIADFSKSPQYPRIHVVMVGALPDNLLKKLGSSKAIRYMASFKELFLDFLAPEDFVYHLDMRDSFFHLYRAIDRDSHVKTMASKFVGVVFALNELPIIKFVPGAKSGSLVEQFALEVQRQLEHGLETGLVQCDKGAGPRSILLVVDRSQDPATPVLHEFTYQAMVNDLLDDRLVDGKIYKATGTEEGERELVLDDHDEIWTKAKHVHIAEVINQIVADFNRFRESNKAAIKSADQNAATNIKDLKETLADIPQYQEMKSRFSTHIGISQSCMKRFNSDKLATIAGFEQNMATGLTPKREELSSAARLNDIVPTITDPDVPEDCRARLVMLYLITNARELTRVERDRILSCSNVSGQYAEAVTNLQAFRGDQDWSEMGKPAPERLRQAQSYELSRYVPPLKTMVEDLLANVPDDRVKTLADSANISRIVQHDGGLDPARSLRRKNRRLPGRRIIVYVLGGVCHSEIRSMHEIMCQNKEADIVIGGTHISTPRVFIQDLASLSSEPKKPKKRLPMFRFHH